MDPSLDPVSESTGWLAIGLAVAGRSALVLAAAGVATILLRRRSAATRHLAWCLGLAGALSVPLLLVALPSWSLPILERPPVTPAAEPRGAAESVVPPVPSTNLQPPIATPSTTLIDPPARAATSRPIKRFEPANPASWLIVAWSLGALVVLGRFVVATVLTRRLATRSKPIAEGPLPGQVHQLAARLGLNRPVALVRGGPDSMPMTWGVVRPVVLLPEGAEQWAEERRRVVLLHELAHVRRRDCLTQWLGLAACALYWFNPLAWWAAARLRAERERACDDLVLEAGERPSDYAAHLLVLARSLRPAPTASLALAMARPSGLAGRLTDILDPCRRRRGPSRRLAALGLLAVLALAAPVSAIRLDARAPDNAAKPGTPGREVAGQIVDPDGRPVAGAVVALLTASEQQGKPTLLGRGESDLDGRFRLSHAKSADATLAVAAPGFGFTAIDASRLDAPIRLEPERPTTVRLVDLQGAPIAGATVELKLAWSERTKVGLDNGWLALLDAPGISRRWTTDADGRIEVRGIGPEHSVTFAISAEGFGMQNQEIDISPLDESASVTLALTAAHVVRGRVTLAESGAPAVGARLVLTSFTQPDGYGMRRGEAEATTDADGRYRAEVAPGEAIRALVYPPLQGADAALIRAATIDPGDRVASDVDFALPRGVLVRGRVVEAGTGRPVEGAVVSHEDQDVNNPYYIENSAVWLNGTELRAKTEADGTFHLAVMPGPGHLLVKGPTPDYLHQEISGVDLAGQFIWPNTRHYPDAFLKMAPKPDEGPLDVQVELRRGATVAGSVVDANGSPVKKAAMITRWFVPDGQFTVNFSQRTQPVRDGRFELRGADPGSSAPLLFLDAETQRGAMVEITGRQAGQEQMVRLQHCGSASVRFIDKEGKPFAAGRTPAHLEVALSDGGSFADLLPENIDMNTRSPLMADSFHVSNLDTERYRDLKTDADGRMTFPTLIPGATYRVVVFNQPIKTQIEFTVEPGESKDLGDLTITKPDQVQ